MGDLTNFFPFLAPRTSLVNMSKVNLVINLAATPAKHTLSGLARICLIPCLFLMSSNLPAPDLKPPLQALRDPNYTLVVAERTNSALEDGRMEFRVYERLKGNPDLPEKLQLLVLPSDDSDVEPGERYLVFYSDVERADHKSKAQVRRPDRAQLLHIDGASPAVFPDTYAMRTLLTPGHSDIELDPQYAAVVMQGLRSGDPKMVDLWSAEWTLRPVTFGEVSPDDVETLSEIIVDPNQYPSARSRILLTSAERSSTEVGDWFVTSAMKVLGSVSPAQLSENTGLSQLIYASLQIAQGYPGDSSASQLEKWLKAAPPLAEKAALALRAIDPKLEREAVSLALADEKTPEQTRVFLNDHLRRLDLAEKRT